MHELDDIPSYFFVIVILISIKPLSGMLLPSGARFYIPRADFSPFLLTGILPLPPLEIDPHRS